MKPIIVETADGPDGNAYTVPVPERDAYEIYIRRSKVGVEGGVGAVAVFEHGGASVEFPFNPHVAPGTWILLDRRVLTDGPCVISVAGGVIEAAGLVAYQRKAGTTAYGSSLSGDPPAEFSIRGHLPQEMVIASWRRTRDGRLLRGDLHLLTDRRWWQRFPLDLATEFWPWDLVIHAEGRLELKPMRHVDDAALAAMAHDRGWNLSADPLPQAPQDHR